MGQNLYAEGVNILKEGITIKKLQAHNVKTIADVDIYRRQHSENGQTKSRYITMVDLFGQAAADRIMRGLEVGN